MSYLYKISWNVWKQCLNTDFNEIDILIDLLIFE